MYNDTKIINIYTMSNKLYINFKNNSEIAEMEGGDKVQFCTCHGRMAGKVIAKEFRIYAGKMDSR